MLAASLRALRDVASVSLRSRASSVVSVWPVAVCGVCGCGVWVGVRAREKHIFIYTGRSAPLSLTQNNHIHNSTLLPRVYSRDPIRRPGTHIKRIRL